MRLDDIEVEQLHESKPKMVKRKYVLSDKGANSSDAWINWVSIILISFAGILFV